MGSEHTSEDGLGEQQPFLDGDVDTVEKAQRLKPSCPPSRWRLAVILVFVVVSLFALAALPLSFRPTQGHDEAEHYEADHQGAEHPNVQDGSIFNDDKVPSTPRLRDMSECTLSPSWDEHAPPTTREYHWIITDADLNPDGVFRPMMLINNQFPGPLVECNDGDTIVVRVDNRAANATAIHFHGLLHNADAGINTNTMDGAVGVTQCAIAPASSFTYRFAVRQQSGTYWYHAHHGAQASDGLLGPVVVHSPKEAEQQQLDYATDRVIMVQDHYHDTSAELLMHYLAPDMENNEPVPDNALLNGRGLRSCADFPSRRCDNTSNASPPVFDLAAGQRHRLRIINAAAFADFQIQFDEHPFYVTEVDGTDVHPEPFHRLSIAPGQRYSIVLETNITTAEAFWLRARMVTHCFRVPNPLLEPEVRAIIRYTSPEVTPIIVEPTSRDWPDVIEVVCRDLNTSLLQPVERIAPPPADDYITLRAAFHIGAWRLARGFFNESTWHPNATNPSLHRFLDALPSDDMHTTTNDSGPIAVNNLIFNPDNDFVLQTTGIRTVDIAINNFDDGAHPFHLHGHKLFVLAQGTTGYPPSAADLPAYLAAAAIDSSNPLRRDTVTVEGYGWIIVRVVLDNPGLWMLHCHNTWHSEAGMAMQLLVRSEVVSQWDVDSEQRALCQREGVSRGMRPDDSIWFGQFK